MTTLSPPIEQFTSDKGRAFQVQPGTHEERFPDDKLWVNIFPILFEGEPAGKLFQSESYGRTPEGKPRWHASTRALFWSKAADAPTGIGFDVAAFDSAAECLAAWARSADQILDWHSGEPVYTVYSGWRQRGVESPRAARLKRGAKK